MSCVGHTRKTDSHSCSLNTKTGRGKESIPIPPQNVIIELTDIVNKIYKQIRARSTRTATSIWINDIDTIDNWIKLCLCISHSFGSMSCHQHYDIICLIHGIHIERRLHCLLCWLCEDVNSIWLLMRRSARKKREKKQDISGWYEPSYLLLLLYPTCNLSNAAWRMRRTNEERAYWIVFISIVSGVRDSTILRFITHTHAPRTKHKTYFFREDVKSQRSRYSSISNRIDSYLISSNAISKIFVTADLMSVQCAL